MADNITVNEGTAVVVAADDVSNVLYQRVKLDVGADGLSSPFTGTVAALTTINTLISGEDQTNDVLKVEPQFNYYHYTIGSGTVKSAAGFVHAITINTLSTAPVELFDAIGTAAGTVATLSGSVGSYLYDVKCTTGITIASTTAAACDVTLIYR